MNRLIFPESKPEYVMDLLGFVGVDSRSGLSALLILVVFILLELED